MDRTLPIDQICSNEEHVANALVSKDNASIRAHIQRVLNRKGLDTTTMQLIHTVLSDILTSGKPLSEISHENRENIVQFLDHPEINRAIIKMIPALVKTLWDSQEKYIASIDGAELELIAKAEEDFKSQKMFYNSFFYNQQGEVDLIQLRKLIEGTQGE